jgi:hypothetical protein
MRHYGEQLETFTTAEAKELLQGKPLPTPKKPTTLMVEGNYIYQLANIGKGWYSLEGFRLETRSR